MSLPSVKLLQNGNLSQHCIVEKELVDGKYEREYVKTFDLDVPEVGKSYAVWSTQNISEDSTDRQEYLHFSEEDDDLEDGIVAIDNNSRKFHGWRGTKNGMRLYAYGIRECLKVDVRECKKNTHYKFYFGKDEVKGEP